VKQKINMKKILLYTLLLTQICANAQISSPIETEKVIVNKSNKYASLFRFFENRKNGDTLSSFAWVVTNKDGGIVGKVKKLNSIFSSTKTALYFLPTGYSFKTQDIENFQNDKYIAYMVNYPLDNIVKTKKSFDEWIQAGATEIVIPIRWGRVFRTISSQKENSASAWAEHDDLVNYAKAKGVKVSLRICVDMDDSDINDMYGGAGEMYKLSNSAKDEWGQVTRISGGSGHSSLAYEEGRKLMLDFVSKTLNRYNTILGSQFLWYSVVMTAQEETGYNFENATYMYGNRTDAYPALFDYSAHAIKGFREWLSAKYKTTKALNIAWGTNYNNIDDATPPTTGKPLGTATQADLNGLFVTNRGKDFWEYNYNLIKNFAISAKALSSKMNPKFYAEFGSVSDFASNIRMSSNVRDFATITDGMKAQFGGHPSQDNLAISLDIFRSNYNKKISTEAHIIDFNGQFSVFGNTSVPVFKEIATTWLKKGVESQLKEIVFIADRDNAEYYTALKEVAIDLKSYLFNYKESTPTIATVNYTQGDILNNYWNVLNTWKSAGGSTNNRINLLQSSEIVGTETGTGGVIDGSVGAVLSLYDNAYYNVKQEDTKSSQLSPSYNDDRVMFQAASHSITYTNGDKAKSSYVVKGLLDGQEWLKMTQTKGVTNIESNGAYSNNHPDRRYTSSLTEDCVFYLPIQDYEITMTNTGTTSFTFSVIQPHNPNPNGFPNFEMTLNAGESYTYTVYSSRMKQQQWYERAIKINCNKLN